MKLSYCKHCKTETTDLSNANKANHSRWCDENPKRKEYTDKLKETRNIRIGMNIPAWNKGLSKETDIRLKDRGIKLKAKYDSGELVPGNKGQKKTDAQKEVDRQAALKSNHQRVCKSTVDYICIDGSTVKLDSSWEVTLAKMFDEEGIIWERPKPLKWTSDDGKIHNYFADFYIPDWNVYLDPKNDWVIANQADKLKCLSEQYNNIFILKKSDLNLKRIIEIIK